MYQERIGEAVCLYRVDVQDKTVTRLTNPSASTFRRPAHPKHSPDGKWIAFLAFPSERKNRASDKAQLFVMHPDGSDVRQVTDFQNQCGEAFWHGDSQTIAFEVYEDLPEPLKQTRKLWKYRTALYLVRIENEAEPRRLPASDGDSFKRLGGFYPGAGNVLAYASSCGERFAEGWRNWDIRVLNANSGELSVITDNDFYDTEPLFSPDGKMLLLVSEPNNVGKDADKPSHCGDLYTAFIGAP